MSVKPKKKCCLSKPRCTRCPIRMLAEGTLPDGFTVHRLKLVKVDRAHPKVTTSALTRPATKAGRDKPAKKAGRDKPAKQAGKDMAAKKAGRDKPAKQAGKDMAAKKKARKKGRASAK